MECLRKQKLYYNQKQNSLNNMNVQEEKIQKKKIHRIQQTNQYQNEFLMPNIKKNNKRHVQQRQQNNKGKKQKNSILFRKHQYQGKEFTQLNDLKTNMKTIRNKIKTKYILSNFNEIVQFGDNLVNVCSLDPQNTYKCSDWRIMNEDTSCNCSNSQCMKNYCECYRVNARCSQNCSCKHCKNDYQTFKNKLQQLNQINTKVRQEMIKRNIKISTKKEQKNSINICVCKKEGNCLKSYCGCHKLGINCSKLCRCIGCKN